MSEFKVCPSCGALPCHWTDPPSKPTDEIEQLIDKTWGDFINCQTDRYFGNTHKSDKQKAVLRKFAVAIAAMDSERLREPATGERVPMVEDLADVIWERLPYVDIGVSEITRAQLAEAMSEAVLANDEALFASLREQVAALRSALNVAAADFAVIQTLNTQGASDQTYIGWLRSNAAAGERNARVALKEGPME